MKMMMIKPFSASCKVHEVERAISE